MNCVVRLRLKDYRLLESLYVGVQNQEDLFSAIEHMIKSFSACNKDFVDSIETIGWDLFPQEEDENETNEYERF